MGNEIDFENKEELNDCDYDSAEARDLFHSRMQQLTSNLAEINNNIIAAVKSDAMQALINISSRIIEQLSTFDYSSILERLGEAFIPLEYLDILKRTKWPVFLVNDNNLRNDILAACKESDNIDAVRELIFSFCDDVFLESLERDWNNSEVMEELRKPILSEALLMHKQEHYYASTSILMCQVYGIASDIMNLLKKNEIEADDELKTFVSEAYNIRREDVDKEKGRIMQMVAMTESGQLLWDAMAEYLQKEILSSSESKTRWATQPLRNKICHGDQLNFGTKEHSLKAILTIDMLIQLGYEIQRIIEVNSSEEIENGTDIDEQ